MVLERRGWSHAKLLSSSRRHGLQPSPARHHEAPKLRATEKGLLLFRPSTCEHLFISYATENWPFAQWIGLKLIGDGYNVWCDRLIQRAQGDCTGLDDFRLHPSNE